MRLRWLVVLVQAVTLLGLSGAARAHFQLLIPSTDVADEPQQCAVRFDIRFTHPMQQGPVMEMGRPRQFGVLVGGKKEDLRPALETRKVDGKTAYSCVYAIRRPGDYVFYLEPAPYWEPVERKMIVHYTKVVVDGLGAEEGWDARVGLPVEIEPLVRPYGLWTGNTFRGIVLRDGRPVPLATIEVEYNNEGRQIRPPNAAFATQVVKADAQGTFSYTMPRAGWWGFAALVDGGKMQNPAGEEVDSELGGLLWVKTVDMK